MDLPLEFTIRESSHRILNALTSEKLATLGDALAIRDGSTLLDLACGKGELLCTWARDYGLSGTGVDLSTVFTEAAKRRAAALRVEERVKFIQGDASRYVAEAKVDIAACVGATWIGGGVAGTIALLERSLKPGGLILIGEPYWRIEPADEETVVGCLGGAENTFLPLHALTDQFGDLGWDLVEIVLADQDSWDRYVAPQWMNVRRWLDANPGHALHERLRADMTDGRRRYLRYGREHLGWGVFALLKSR